MRAGLAAALLLAGLLACAFGVLIWASTARSDTATSSLVAFGLMFVVPGVVAIGAATWLLRGRPPRG